MIPAAPDADMGRRLFRRQTTWVYGQALYALRLWITQQPRVALSEKIIGFIPVETTRVDYPVITRPPPPPLDLAHDILIRPGRRARRGEWHCRSLAHGRPRTLPRDHSRLLPDARPGTYHDRGARCRAKRPCARRSRLCAPVARAASAPAGSCAGGEAVRGWPRDAAHAIQAAGR